MYAFNILGMLGQRQPRPNDKLDSLIHKKGYLSTKTILIYNTQVELYSKGFCLSTFWLMPEQSEGVQSANCTY